MPNILTNLQFYLPVVKDFVTIVSLIIASVVAILGLQTWRRQLKGTAEYDLARKVLMAVYKLRDETFSFQFLLVMRKQNSIGRKRYPTDREKMEGEELKNRKAVVDEAEQTLRVLVKEMEALLHKEEAEQIMGMLSHYLILNYAFFIEEINFRSPETIPSKNISFRNTEEEKEYFDFFNNEDSYKSNVNSTVRSIENIMKPFLLKK